MFKLIVILLLSQLAAVLGADFRDGRIVGGQPVDIKDHPYQVALQLSGTFFCGGSILTSRYILTAAHCVYIMRPSSLSVRAGSSYKNTGGQVANVASIHTHPSFDETTIDYDIAILGLKVPLTEGSPINLPKREYLDETAFVTGWGALSAGGSGPIDLRGVSVPILGFCKCKSSYSGLTFRMLCAGYMSGGKDACQGDSGGPLVVGNVQVGIVSFGHGCADRGYPGVYANVFELRTFINNITGLPIVL